MWEEVKGMWGSMGRCGKMWGEVWGNMGRCGKCVWGVGKGVRSVLGWVEVKSVGRGGGVERCWERSRKCEKVWGEVRCKGVLGKGKSVPHLSPDQLTSRHLCRAPPHLPSHFSTSPTHFPPPSLTSNHTLTHFHTRLQTSPY